MIVDSHAHVVVPGLGADVEWRDGVQVVSYRGQEIRAAVTSVFFRSVTIT